MALSFGLGTSSMTPFSLASASGLSMGTDTRDRDAGDPRRGTFATGGGTNWTMGGSTLTPAPSTKTATKPLLSFGSSVPKYTPIFSNNQSLSYGTSVPKIDTSNRFSIGSGLSGFLNTFSLGTPVGASAYSAPRPSTIAALPSSIITSPAQVDTVTMAGGSGMADVAKDLAGQIFADMLTPTSAAATPAGGAGAQFGGGSTSNGGGFMDRIGTMEIVIGAAALGLAFMLLSGGSNRAPARRAPARRAPARRKKR